MTKFSSQAREKTVREPRLRDTDVSEVAHGTNGRKVPQLGPQHTEFDEPQRLGDLLVNEAKISPAERDRILEYARKKGLKFGEAAIKLKLVSKTDIQHSVAAQFDYPFLKKGEGGHSDNLWTAYAPFSAAGKKLRNLRTQLLLHWEQSEHGALVVVSPDNAELSSLVAANLAVTFSQSGSSTLLVDGNLQEGGQRKLFSLDHDSGLSLVLLNRLPLERAIQRLPEFRNLSVLPSGAVPPNPADLLVRRKWSTLTEELKRRFDVVIFDSPVYAEDGCAEMISRVCGSALLTLHRNRTRLSDAQHLTESMRAAGTEVVGSILAGT